RWHDRFHWPPFSRSTEPARRVSCRLLEENDAGRVAMDEVLAADRTDFAHGEEAGDGYRPIDLVDHAHVVIGLVEEPRAAAVACEEQRPDRPSCWFASLEQTAQIFIGGFGVADMELDGLANTDHVRDLDGTGIIGPHHVAHQEVAALERALVLVDHPADVQAILNSPLIVAGKLLKHVP